MLKEFTRFTLLRTKKGRRKLPWVVFFSVVAVGGSVLIMLSRGFDWKLAALAIVILLMDALIAYVYRTAGASIEKTNPALLKAINEYDFQSRYFEVKTQGSAEKADRVRYDQVDKVIKTPKYYYLFLTQTSAYIISREELLEGEDSAERKKGNADDRLAHFLQEKMGADRYFERLK